jgi:hypothetical protein
MKATNLRPKRDCPNLRFLFYIKIILFLPVFSFLHIDTILKGIKTLNDSQHDFCISEQPGIKL